MPLKYIKRKMNKEVKGKQEKESEENGSSSEEDNSNNGGSSGTDDKEENDTQGVVNDSKETKEAAKDFAQPTQKIALVAKKEYKEKNAEEDKNYSDNEGEN